MNVNAMKSAVLSLMVLSSVTLFLPNVSATSIALVGGTAHTLNPQATDEVIDNATILIADGVIQSVTAGGEVPSGYQVIDVAGKVVTPGLFGAYTGLGLEEVPLSAGQVDSSVDSHPVSAVGAAMDVSFAVYNDATVIGVNRLEGLTAAATSIQRTEHLFHGQGAVIGLSNKVSDVHKARAFIATDVRNGGASNNGGSRGVLWVAIHKALDEASQWADTMSAPTSAWYGMTTKADAMALKAVVDGQIPLLVAANRAADIQQVIALKSRYRKLRPVVVHGMEAWRVAEQLAAANIPVILNPEVNLPGGFDELGATLENAARLHQAGVLVAIGIETHNIRLATQHAGNAVANGLPHAAGLAAVTLNPAKIFAVDDQLGSLTAGKQADLVVWSGDPLEVTEAAERVIINGQLMPMEARNTKLRDRYLQYNGKLPAPWVRVY